VIPAEKVSISQERLAGALARLPETAAAPVPVPANSVSPDERAAARCALPAERGTAPLGETFAAAATQLEAVATFLALLELLKRGEVSVEPDATGVMVVRRSPAWMRTPTWAVHRHREAWRSGGTVGRRREQS
jgi:hypothetical protein